MTLRLTGVDRWKTDENYNRKIRKNYQWNEKIKMLIEANRDLKIIEESGKVRSRTGMRRGHKVSHHQSALLIKASTLITNTKSAWDAQDSHVPVYLYINRNYPLGINRSWLNKHTNETTDSIGPKDQGINYGFNRDYWAKIYLGNNRAISEWLFRSDPDPAIWLQYNNANNSRRTKESQIWA